MNTSDDYGNLLYLAGSLFTKVQELNAVLRRLKETGQHQGELHLTHRQANGEVTQLALHIDGMEFTMMPGDVDTGLRLDISGSTARIE